MDRDVVKERGGGGGVGWGGKAAKVGTEGEGVPCFCLRSRGKTFRVQR